MLEYFAYYLIAINFFAFAAFGYDKAQAEAGGRRVSENALIQLAVMGGLPGAYTGRALFRHKTRKKSFTNLLSAVLFFYVVGAGVLGFLIWDASASDPVVTPEHTDPVAAQELYVPSTEFADSGFVDAAESSVYYPGCNDVRAAGKAPLYRGQPGYRSGMDGDDDGIACEPMY
ncbi:DUF1294 domain-containing protein [Qipengyuania marisflavi]|uniref:DUF1294 domain-containing protein n=1 Tax=Qipengyuania marisflavi TaxID=2486356 RepID=UPI001FECB028|nr:DUF1294 domain-containing protein [Qipengyuania marisflavi]